MKNKITHEVKLLTCDLMWKICIPFFAPVNSRGKANIFRIAFFHEEEEGDGLSKDC
jgi:hypothetical protein